MASTDPSSTPGTTGASSAMGAAKQASETVREQASEMAGQVKQQAESMLEGQKQTVAERIEGVADALRESASRLDKEVHANLSGYAEQAIQRLDSAAEALRNRDIATLLADVESFARRQPTLFLAGSVVAGFALARFLKSSSQSRSRAGHAYGEDGEMGALARERAPMPLGYSESSLAGGSPAAAGAGGGAMGKEAL